jgi:simple sugar transport system substrate-binding protein
MFAYVSLTDVNTMNSEREEVMKRQTIVHLLIFLLVAGLLLVACTPDVPEEVQPEEETAVEEPTEEPMAEEPTEEAMTEEPTEEAMTEEPTEEATAEEVYMAMVMHQAIPYTAQIQAGWEAFCESQDDLVCDYAVPDSVDPQTQIGMFESFVSKGAQGIVTNCVPADVWVEPVKAARERGILVNSVDVACLPESEFNVQVGPLYFSQGQVFAKGFFDELEAKGVTEGTVVFGYCAPGYQSQEDRMATLLAECEERGTYECVGNLDSGHNTDLNYSFWENATIRYADAVAFAGTCAFDGPNLMKLKQLTGADWEIGTYDLEPETLEGLQSGEIMIAIGNNPFLNGYVAGQLLYEHLKSGEPLTEAGLIDTPPELVTSRNVDEFLALEGDPELRLQYTQQVIEEMFPNLDEAIVPLPY